MVTLEELQSMARYQSGDQRQAMFLRDQYWDWHYSIFVDDVDSGIERTLSKFANDIPMTPS